MNRDNHNQNSGLDGREIALLIILVGGGVWYKYGQAIQLFVHQNMVRIVLAAIAVVTICGYIGFRRFARKNEEDIARMRRLREARPKDADIDKYYRRPEGRGDGQK